MIKLFIADTAGLDLASALENVSSARREKALRLMDEDARRRCLGAGLLLKAVCGRDDYAIGQNGKPYFEDGQVHFSLAHCKNHVLCALFDAPVGADIELPRSGGVRLAERFFAADELHAVSVSPAPDAEFCRLWTMKESYIKLRGLRLADMAGFSVIDSAVHFNSLRYGEYFIACCSDKPCDVQLIEKNL